MKQTCYTLYGLRVDPGEKSFVDLDEEIGQVANDGNVGYFQAGAHDEDMTFLALTWREVELGEYVMHPGDRAHASAADRDQWNEALRAAAQRLGLRVIDGPGWFTVPDEY
jgi:hypothetical protein